MINVNNKVTDYKDILSYTNVIYSACIIRDCRGKNMNLELDQRSFRSFFLCCLGLGFRGMRLLIYIKGIGA